MRCVRRARADNLTICYRKKQIDVNKRTDALKTDVNLLNDSSLNLNFENSMNGEDKLITM